MAIFTNGDQAHKGVKSDTNTTIITSGAKIKGEIDISCNLYIDGDIEGIINSKKDINIGKNGAINGEIFAHRVVVQGKIEGSVNAQRVEIKAEGKIIGTIESSELVIEAKGIFEGKSVVKESTSKTLQKKQSIDKS